VRLRASAPEQEAPSPAVRRLRRLRLTLTLLFTGAMAVGLAALGLLVLHKDSEARLDDIDGVMGRRVAGSSRLIYYSNRGRLRLDGLRDDDLTTGPPEVRVYDGTGPRPRLVFAGAEHPLPVTYGQLGAIAHEAAQREEQVATTVTDGDGMAVRLLAGPFFRDPDGNAAGAVVSAASLAPGEAAHRELVVTILGACAGLLILAAGTGYLLAGRSLKPAVRSLVQQEGLIADAAHELRTPIASIRASLESAQLDPGAASVAIETARTTSVRMGDTLDALLIWARLEAGTEQVAMTQLRLDQLVEDVVEHLDRDDRVDLVAEPVVVRAKAALIRIGVRNLVDNALVHGAAPDGRVTVRVAEGAVTVHDGGPGLPPEMLKAAGVPRFRSARGGGTGLGLWMTARIAEFHGGDLIARNGDGGGAELRLVLDGAAAPR
jgi:two-component system OmpR family sensor kinase